MIRVIRDQVTKKNRDCFEKLLTKCLENADGETIDPNKTSIECQHLAKFLSRLDYNTEIIKKSEKPDFIIKSGKKLIGLEHEILVDEKVKSIEGSFEDLAKYSEQEFCKKNPKQTGYITLYFHNYFRYRKADKSAIINEIITLISNYIETGQLEDNSLLHRIFVQPFSQLKIVSNPGAWWKKVINSDLLTEAVLKKEEKIESYIENTGIEDQWLLIVMGSLGESSFEGDINNELELKVETKFKKVFLFEDFRANIYEIK